MVEEASWKASTVESDSLVFETVSLFSLHTRVGRVTWNPV